MIQITTEQIDVTRVLQAAQCRDAGAVVMFLGTTRARTGTRQTASLDYECYREMAEKSLAKLEEDARQRWELLEVCVVHRVGRVTPGEASVVIAVSSPHRDAAFAAGRWLIDTLKQVVPIWKRENWADGTCEWQHPGSDGPAAC
jgi:molybdopterin synthase catalytic subunit